jgi:Transcription factor WhiB
MTNATQPRPRRAVVLGHLSQDPAQGRTASDLARKMGTTAGSLAKLLRSMEQHGQVIAVPEWHPQQGRTVSLWHIAPPGTVPPPRPVRPEVLEQRRMRNTEAQRARRARLRKQLRPSPRPLGLPPGAACAGEDPELFFPAAPEDEAKAKAICAHCPIRRECHAAALASGQEFGIWAGVNFETARSDPR